MMMPNLNPPSSYLHPHSSSSSPIQETDNYLMTNTGSNSASGSFQNNENGFLYYSNNEGSGGSGSGNNSDVEFGFLRPELVRRQNNPPLVGTVEIYNRHIFLCYKNPKVWPPHVEAAEFDRLPRLLSAALLAKKAEINRMCCRRLTHFDVDTFVEEVLVKDGEWHPGTPEALKGSYVFVCSHGSRDRRCGVCGPALVTRFSEEIDAHGLQGQVSVSPCSHIGGHKYAGNVIIFCRDVNGEVTGHWYGYVTPDDVPILLEQHIGKGEIIDQLWRGQMGLSEDDQKKAQELRLQLSSETGMEKGTKVSIQTFEAGHPGNCNQVEVAGCCQGIANTICCQNSVSAEEVENNNVVDRKEPLAAAGRNTSGKQINRTIKGRGACTRKVCAMPTWFESWEREDTYAALSVVGAIVSVAIAYSSYKQLRNSS
ncbi:hypothetical protein IFM89_012136 [Coptis chinensis]|uniref:Sucrase/ferredoxin-like family protein n=1 Tax=Coptis chinensis TaxID=261450 RepID=A0A835I1R6_9MAGN|nr:hypothetical protein IFM89_012136 [Coptis chinensis]